MRPYFAVIYSYNQEPSKFKARPKLPKYKHKIEGRNLLIYTRQAISKPEVIKNKIVLLSKSKVKIKTGISYESIAQVRIIPKLNYYVIEVVYERDQVDLALDKNQIAGLDLGVNNLATVTSNKIGFQPIIVNGRPVKSINQYYNKQKAKLQSQLKDKKPVKRFKNWLQKEVLKWMIICIKPVDLSLIT